MSIRRFILAMCASTFVLCGYFAAGQEDEATSVDEDEAAEAEAEDVEAEDEAVDEDAVEEVIVTGSHIRRSSFDLPSPTDTIDEIDLEFSATTDIGDVIFDQTYQIGVNANAAPFETGADDQGGRDLSGTEVFPNLRGLGTRATMTMMDGHRVPANVTGYSFWTRRAGSDATTLYPGVAIGRVETILDGASAIYGSEAVSGVINFIPRKNFDGLVVNYEYQMPEGTSPSKRFALLSGAKSERTSALFALEIRDEDSIPLTDRPRYIINATGWTGQLVPTWGLDSGWSHPGDWNVPTRDSNGDPEAPPLENWQNFPFGTAPPGYYTDPAEGNTPAPGAPGGNWWYRYPSAYPGSNDYRYQGVDFTYDGGGGWEDNVGKRRFVKRADPGCEYPFASGNSDRGDPSTADEFGLAYNDASKPGNFLNGYFVGNVRGLETRSVGDHRQQRGGTGVAGGSPEDCRLVRSDWQDIRAEREQEHAMGYFNHEFNDNLSFRGEFVAVRLDYSTRNHAYHVDEWDQGARRYGPQVAVAIGSNPGNPFRAFIDGSNSCDLMPELAGCDTWNAMVATTYDADHDDPDEESENVFARSVTADTFLSYFDANGNGRYDYMQEGGELLIYAQDANGDGLPDRDLNGDGVADAGELSNAAAQIDPQFRVVLLSRETDTDGDGVPDRFDPDSHRNCFTPDAEGGNDSWAAGSSCGVRLFEDVRVDNLAPHPKNPYVHESYPWLNEDMSFDYSREITAFRARLGTTYIIPETEWFVDFDWIWSQKRSADAYLEALWPFSIAAMRCQGGPSSGRNCYNPFSTAWLDSDPETGELLPAYRQKSDDNPDENCDPALGEVSASCAWNTSTEVRYAGLILREDVRQSNTHIVDFAVSNGSLFDLWYNDKPVGVAAGIHYRVEREEQQPNQISEALWGSARYVAQQTQEETGAVFAELQVFPLDHPDWGTLEIQVAGRYAEFEAGGSIASAGQTAQFDVTIPKFAASYRFRDWLAIRGSRTEGFVLPGMFQLFGEEDAYTNRNATARDYVCDVLPEISHCIGVFEGGSTPGIITVDNAPNQGLGAEISDLWNAGVSLRLLDGRLLADLDYTSVDFNGRVERIGTDQTMRNAEIGFEAFVQDRCGQDTLLDYDNSGRWPADEYPDIPRTSAAYIAETDQGELDCREAAVAEWLPGEAAEFGDVIIRDATGRLEQVNNGWINQGEQSTRTLIFNGSYRFESDELPFINGDYGSFTTGLSITKMLELSLVRWADGGPHNYAGIRVDGVGNRNIPGAQPGGSGTGLYGPLPPTPEYRANMSLRWFRGSHSAQLSVRWHDSITDVNAAWDEVIADYRADRIEAGQDPDADPNGYHGDNINGVDATQWSESEACNDQDRNPQCKVDSRHYWDISYSYNRPDFLGLGYISVNLAMRNIFGTMPDPMPSGAGYEQYLDDIMGRQAFARISLGF